MQYPLSEDERRKLVKEALVAREKAYAPYSGYYVGAALLCEDGSVFHGVNIENASSPAGICAERSAFAAAVSGGKRDFRAIAVVGGSKGQEPGESPVAYPCGVCRQFMSELCNEGFEIIAGSLDGEFSVFTMKQLLPFSFRL